MGRHQNRPIRSGRRGRARGITLTPEDIPDLANLSPYTPDEPPTAGVPVTVLRSKPPSEAGPPHTSKLTKVSANVGDAPVLEGRPKRSRSKLKQSGGRALSRTP